jgi:nitrile hydratase accessory protein
MSNCRTIRDELLDEPARPLLRENEGSAFRDSWEAEAFAMGNLLIKSGFISQAEWVEIFSQEIKAAQNRGDPDQGDTYYSHWMSALERIALEQKLTDRETLEEMQHLWGLAVQNTPHGVPLRLENAYLDRPHGHNHDHDHHHTPLPELLKPVSVSGQNEPIDESLAP